MQAAVGTAQLKKLSGFTETRRENFRVLREWLEPLESHLVLPEPTPGSAPPPPHPRAILRWVEGRTSMQTP